MNDAALIATEIQDLASTVGEVAQAINKRPPPQVTVNVPEQAAPTVEVRLPVPVVNVEPQVTVNVPEQRPPAVEVNVPSPVVHLEAPVYVPTPEPRAYEVRITERDRQGLILSFVITPQAA